MKPIQFAEQNTTIAKSQPPYLPFPAHVSWHTNLVTACWKLTWRERFAILFSGVVWHQISTHGRPLQPQKLTVEKPDMK